MEQHQSGQQGLTLVETLICITLFVVLGGAVLNAMTSGQLSFATNEIVLQAQQTARNALDVIAQDLTDAQLYSYEDGNGGSGKFYVKFRRLQNAFIDSNGMLQWDNINNSLMRMYVWCPGGAPAVDPCARIVDFPTGVPTDIAGVGPLLLTTPGPGNSDGENNGAWRVQRVLAPQVTGAEQNTVGFLVKLFAGDGTTAITRAMTECNAHSPNGSELCVNRRLFQPPGPSSAAAFGQPVDVLPVTVTVSLSTRARTSSGRVATNTVQTSIRLRNQQEP